ncbi:MAG: PilZ domain-containing protein [Candidatus Acidiferrales bacterium]
MGRRSEQRIVIAFPVVVRGTDARGSPFVVTTETHDVSCTGASLRGLQGVADAGAKVEIESQNQKAWYRVQWASAANRRKEWRIGVRCLEPGKYIWGVPPKEWEPDSFDHHATNSQTPPMAGTFSPAAQEPPRERRRFARHACRLEAQVIAEGAYGKVEVKGKITDISLGGCYVEMLAPLPEETALELAFTTGNAPLHLAAKVCTAQDGFGMGLVFTGMNPEEFEILRQFAPPAKNHSKNGTPAKYAAPHAGIQPQDQRASIPQASNSRAPSARISVPAALGNGETRFELYQTPPAPEISPLDVPDPATALEGLVRLLIRKNVFSLSELLEELEKLKATHT